MIDNFWGTGFIGLARTISQILTAGIAITAFSILLNALSFNLRDRVVRSFAVILLCVVIVFTAEAIGSTVAQNNEVDLWLRMQWIGIILLPPAYLNFSDAILATTGKPSQWRRRWAIRIFYLVSFLFLISLPYDGFVGSVVLDKNPAPHLEPTIITDIFTVWYVLVMGMAWYNFARSYRRTTTPTSRRRMMYLIFGALAPALGSFPYLLYGSEISSQHPIYFWIVAITSNLLVAILLVIIAYSVAFFGVTWPDRVIKTRLFKWLLRGPTTAILALAITTIIRRVGTSFGSDYSIFVPISLVATILLCEFLITILNPFWEKALFYGKDKDEIEVLHELEERLITRNDLTQFLEVVLAKICDRLQSPGAYVTALEMNSLEYVAAIGKTNLGISKDPDQLLSLISNYEDPNEPLEWKNDLVISLQYSQTEDQDKELLGFLVINREGGKDYDEEQKEALAVLAERATIALNDRRIQQQVFSSLQFITPEVELIQKIRAEGRYELIELSSSNDATPMVEMAQWVKEALMHFWGGPKLTESRLLNLTFVRESVERNEGNTANALRTILRDSIERIRPEGERRFTAEWILYNILDMKFIEGRKVREIALRLSISEADLYRKQRVAIDAIAKVILDIENQRLNQSSN